VAGGQACAPEQEVARSNRAGPLRNVIPAGTWVSAGVFVCQPRLRIYVVSYVKPEPHELISQRLVVLLHPELHDNRIEEQGHKKPIRVALPHRG
jgi:hypothetical protein